LAIADYYPYEIIDFFSLCKEKAIKPIWGVKIFGQENPPHHKLSLTIYPQNNKGCKEIIQRLFAANSPPDRTFLLDYVLSHLSKSCLIIFEARKLEEINYLAQQWILNPKLKKEINRDNLFIGFNFFLFSPTTFIPTNVIPLLIPFFSVKTLISEEIKLLDF